MAETVGVEVDLVPERVLDLDPGLLADITTADAVAQGPTVLVHVLVLTVAVHHRGDINLPLSFPISSPRAVTTAIATPRPVVGIVTAGAEDRATRGNGPALERGPARRSKWTVTGNERGSGRGTETAAPSTCPQRNTNTIEAAVTGATGGTGRGLDPTTGTETGSAATRANTTAAAATRDTVATGAESHR